VSCPGIRDTYAAFASIPSLVALVCFGDTSISFTAKVMRPEATCGLDPVWVIVPHWLGAVCPQPEFIVFDPAGAADEFYSITEPDFDSSKVDVGVTPEEAVDVVVTGRRDATPGWRGGCSTHSIGGVPSATSTIPRGAPRDPRGVVRTGGARHRRLDRDLRDQDPGRPRPADRA